ncbi:carbon-nitrogen hydrolase family protein [Cedecea neteri]|uniref:Carbon-nitrogen hydrolase family protein n=1 Tax=Cedecea neteri TaxID=158822 RepID=A0A291DWZ7_9ENTR|nr:carbon-nitrogen hydrolase family protein [Cedecea neteri]ATF92209.1 carbon-nitrogen hydrolase family protein [Cedecea neteri]
MPRWNVAAAQYGAVAGSYQANIDHHLDFIRCAAEQGIDLLVFPHLSLSGLRPDNHPPAFTDSLFDPLSEAARRYPMTVIVGMSLGDEAHNMAGMVSFLPDGSRIACCKRPAEALDAKAQPPVAPLLGQRSRNIALAVCAQSDDEAWPRSAADIGADLYATGAAMTELSYQQDEMYMQRWAHKYGLTILQANYAWSGVEPRAAGRSACWDNLGQLVVRADQGELLAIGRRDERGWHGEVIPLR